MNQHRETAITVLELLKGFSEEQHTNATRTCVDLANIILELTAKETTENGKDNIRIK
jgi:hypothetical protein